MHPLWPSVYRRHWHRPFSNTQRSLVPARDRSRYGYGVRLNVASPGERRQPRGSDEFWHERRIARIRQADCLYQSAVNGKPTPSAGTLKTIMAGLACREVSPAAWKVLEWLASDYVAIPDSWSSHAMTALADGAGDVPIVSGDSAAAGLGVLLKAAKDPELRGKLGLNEASQVVLFGGEGATDPQIYAEIVGCSADEVFERQRERRSPT